MTIEQAPQPHGKTPVRIALRRCERATLNGSDWRRLGLDAAAFPYVSPALRSECDQPIVFLGEAYPDVMQELHQIACAISKTTERIDRRRGAWEDEACEERVRWAARATEAIDAIGVRVLDCASQLGLAPF